MTCIRTLLTASLLSVVISGAQAQTAGKTTSDPSHPTDTTAQAAPMPPSPEAPDALRPGQAGPMDGQRGAGQRGAGQRGGMMGGGAGQMPQMMQMMRMMRGGMPFEHVEGRIAFLKAELAITEAQLPQWNAFADVLRAGAKNMRESMEKMMQDGMPTTAPARVDAMVQMMTAHLDGMKSMADSGKALYAVLTDAQKKTADELMTGPMGRM